MDTRVANCILTQTHTHTHKELTRHHQFTHCQYRINKQQKPQIEKGNFV